MLAGAVEDDAPRNKDLGVGAQDTTLLGDGLSGTS